MSRKDARVEGPAPAQPGRREVDLFAVQPLVSIGDYLSEDAFRAHHRALARRLDTMRPGRSSPALAVWPEYVASFLSLLGSGSLVRGCTTTEEVLGRIVRRHPASLAAVMARHRISRLAPAVMTMLAPKAHAAYVRTFSEIASDFGLWVVAGSGLFPRNRYGTDLHRFSAESAEVFNTSYTFDPAGRLASVTRKVNLVPTQEDILGLSSGRIEDLTVADTPFGRLGTLVCYDGFGEPHTSAEPSWGRCAPVLDRLGAEVVAQPSANAWAWEAPWVFNEAGESLLRSEQWFNEGLPSELGRLRNVRWVVNPQLVGRVLDNSFEAPSLILSRQDTRVEVVARSEDWRAEDILHARASI